ncbi:TPA: host cell division inhibitor Icd-like protein [Enterobacter hormaechei]|uniref:host cell division inhibitor Icd-like protein n=1 Tax=Enterobacter hormaechei TaxID=158836 RepID=UPI00285EA9B7|nr:host cell division inhibitor Icd-like protein [Enterobacter hormaechei]ELD3468742.1 host cell division inhibitor Icd-like protein [Enterobacter hormaechei]MED5732763.1 host cell division inhibitor Icd-like protein [Enterobacter hormaechei]HBM2510949.1 host cell division inhibitor Icd-like protein [Enterobacter hormaechei]HBM2520794.1 host cell division inhibitor Icd-like protein [Enterobacter hormaechei]HBM2529954.1 host cell division inhibitor Icd-like protein [Enterobacter hormaechei]
MTYAKNNRKYRLTTAPYGSQNPDVAPQWATGICSPCNRTATIDAPCVFFYVATNATERHFMAWCYVSGTGLNRSFLHLSLHYAALSMVAQAGQLSGWPVLVLAGTANLVWAIAIMKICSFGDSIICYRTEAANMATTPIHSHPQFVWLFLAVRRSDLSAKPHRAEVTAPDFMSARRTIARDFVASFAGRLPVREVAHV